VRSGLCEIRCLPSGCEPPGPPVHVMGDAHASAGDLGRRGGRPTKPCSAHLLLVDAKVAPPEDNDGRLAQPPNRDQFGAEAGQTVFHLHVHVIGGRPP